MGLTIYLATSDADYSVPLRNALTALALPFAQDPANEQLLVACVVADNPWEHAQALRGANIGAVVVFCTGPIPEPPVEVTADVTVHTWSDAATAASYVAQLIAAGPGVATPLMSTRTPVPPPPGFTPAGTPNAGLEEPELLDDAALVNADEPEFSDDASPLDANAPPPPPPARVLAPTLDSITPEDWEFIKRVFNQVRDVDFRAPPPPPPRKALSGLDKKMQFLRDKTRELERDLARVGFVWRTKQQQVDAVDQTIAAKEAERATAVQRYEQIKDQATRASAQARTEAAQQAARIQDLEATANGLEGQLNKLKRESEQTISSLTARLTKEEQEKVALIAEFRSKIEAAQAAFTQLRDGSARTIGELETKVGTLDQALVDSQASVAARDMTLDEQSRTLAERDHALQALNNEIAAVRAEFEIKVAHLEAELMSVKDSREKLAERLGDRERTLSAITEEMGRTGSEHGERVNELKQTIRDRDARIQGLESEIASARNEFQQLAQEFGRHRDDAGRITEELGQAVADARADARTCKERHTELERLLNEKEQALAAATAALTAAQEDARLAKQDLTETGKRLAELQQGQV